MFNFSDAKLCSNEQSLQVFGRIEQELNSILLMQNFALMSNPSKYSGSTKRLNISPYTYHKSNQQDLMFNVTKDL